DHLALPAALTRTRALTADALNALTHALAVATAGCAIELRSASAYLLLAAGRQGNDHRNDQDGQTDREVPNPTSSQHVSHYRRCAQRRLRTSITQKIEVVPRGRHNLRLEISWSGRGSWANSRAISR